MAPSQPPPSQDYGLDAVRRLRAAAAAMDAGRFAEARVALTALTAAQPRLADARHLLGIAHLRLGDGVAAVESLRAAVALDKRRPDYVSALGEALAATGDARGAERSLRAALALNRRFAPAALALCELLTGLHRPAEAAVATAPLLAAPGVSEALLSAHATALRGLERDEEALAIYRRAAQAFPCSSTAEHNVAAVAGDLLRHGEAETAARSAFAKGGDAPETWMALGRALQGQDRFEAAEDAFREALRRRPVFAEAQQALAQLVWMRTEDVAKASAAIDAAIVAAPSATSLRQVKAALLDAAGEPQAAYAALTDGASARAALEADPQLHLAAARVALRLDPERARAHAEAALAVLPDLEAAQTALCEAHLATGDGPAAAVLAEAMRRRRPLDQHVLAYLATAWRLMGDGRYAALYDYEAFVRPWALEPPAPWSSLDAYLADLALALTRAHGLRAHPIGQSLRGGTQTSQNLRASADPAIAAFFSVIEGPIRAYMNGLGAGKDPLRARNTGRYAIEGVWSVRLRPGGGRHVDHVHTRGWISSACYIALPPAVEEPGHQGWIKFGEPGVPTRPTLQAEHYVKPEPGRLVLFPSYMWHGTVPFEGEAPRLTVAFDLVPGART